jgi:hypothetical protein
MNRILGLAPLARSMAFIYLVAVITAVGSERMFWFWAPGVRTHLEVAAFYAIATATGIMLMRRHRVDSWWSLMLAVPVVAYVVEGVITPVLYSGGPFVPFFPAWFTMWHGIMSFAVLVFVIRYLLLAEAIAKLAMLALGIGVFWGVWSTTQWLPESYEDPELLAEYGALEILGPGAFAGYAALFTAVLIVAHGVIGLFWPTVATAPSGRLTWGERIVGALVLAGAALWTVALPWALPMFGAYAGLQVVALRRHRARVPVGRPDLFAQLAGHVRLRALLPLVLVAPAAALTYAGLWLLEPSDTVLRVLMYSIIAGQAIAGAVITVRALLRVRKGRNRGVGPEMDQPPGIKSYFPPAPGRRARRPPRAELVESTT